MKKYIFLMLFIFSFSLANAWNVPKLSDSCQYKDKFEACYNATNPREITDFVCVKDRWDSWMLFQIILDDKLKKYDKEVEKYLEDLETNKSYYFWQEQKEIFQKAIDYLENTFSTGWEYYNKYYNSCQISWEVWKEAMDCLWTTDLESLIKYQVPCEVLVDIKLDVFKQISINILKLNKLQIIKDEKKKFTQKQRTKYDKLLDIMTMNVWYMEKIWKKWPSKTKD